MLKFLIKGLLRDKNRSFFPVLTVTIGVMLTVLMNCWFKGILGDMADLNARFMTGHVKIMSQAYAENEDQLPNDLALMGVGDLMDELRREYPDMEWVKRIKFGGLLDAPDEKGETRAQGPAGGMAIDLLSGNRSEIERMNIESALARGDLPDESMEILISDEFAQKLGVGPGDEVTLLSSTMYGGMAMQNFTIAGTLTFGIRMMDRGAIIADIADIQNVLDMQDATGEILGYLPGVTYDKRAAEQVRSSFNLTHAASDDEFAPVMYTLREQNDLGTLLDYADSVSVIVVTVFVMVMSIVLWNAGLLGGLRRYGEIGVRLAIGERKGAVYRAMILESVAIGIVGSVLGSAVGLAIAWVLQTYGIDVSSMMQDINMMAPTVYRAHITREAYYLGFFPGVLATVLGSTLSGIGIYRRKTAQLFKELEA